MCQFLSKCKLQYRRWVLRFTDGMLKYNFQQLQTSGRTFDLTNNNLIQVTSLPEANITGAPTIFPPVTSLHTPTQQELKIYQPTHQLSPLLQLVNCIGTNKKQLMMLVTFGLSLLSFVMVLCFILWQIKRERRIANQNVQLNEGLVRQQIPLYNDEF